MTLRSRLAELLHPLRASREELDAADEARGATRRGTVPIGQIVPRHRARVSGVLRALTYGPAQSKPVLVGQLFDGTGAPRAWSSRATPVRASTTPPTS